MRVGRLIVVSMGGVLMMLIVKAEGMRDPLYCARRVNRCCNAGEMQEKDDFLEVWSRSRVDEENEEEMCEFCDVEGDVWLHEQEEQGDSGSEGCIRMPIEFQYPSSKGRHLRPQASPKLQGVLEVSSAKIPFLRKRKREKVATKNK